MGIKAIPSRIFEGFESREFWRENNEGGWATVVVFFFILLWHFGKWVFYGRSRSPVALSHCSVPGSLSSGRISEIISEANLKILIDNLDEKEINNERWENVIDKSRRYLSYKAKCCKLKDSPLKYLSSTVFDHCSTELLRDFYMDNGYRKQWDKTIVEYEQLQVDVTSGIEIGRMVKKFPLLAPREYVLSWRVWEGRDKTFYCFTKECEHPLAPTRKKYVRVGFYRSGWRIRKVPGENACEIKMMHQEDAGLNTEVAKLAFAKGIWSYVRKMDDALRKYSSFCLPHPSMAPTAVSLIQKVPPDLDATDVVMRSHRASSSNAEADGIEIEIRSKEVKKRKEMIANGLLVLGGIICLFHQHGNSTLSAKVAIAYILKKLSRRCSSPGKARSS